MILFDHQDKGRTIMALPFFDQFSNCMKLLLFLKIRGLKKLWYAKHLLNIVRNSGGYGFGTLVSLLRPGRHPQDVVVTLRFWPWDSIPGKPKRI